ncbi:YitT family protein [Oerskovia flava]|uniref:YitT family protein n=1 Tax=Oerskovia flava TaxID=2986422 RepID=UPI00223F6762|nr:YitT family protein [Oerskovia sp. JB1-3-2]
MGDTPLDRTTTPPPLAVGPPHSRLEDVFGILTGTYLASLGLFLLGSVSAVTGGTAGLALLLVQVAPVPFGVLFFAVNVPFFALAVWKKGWGFTAKTAAAVGLVSALSALHPLAFDGPVDIDPVYAVLSGNLVIGIGLLVIFRHGASLGGFNILALVLQERLGWRAGYVQMAFDAVVVLLAFAVAPPTTVLLSVAGVVLLNVVLALNHRPGRYLGH